MSIGRHALVDTLDKFLSASEVRDYCPNGLQVEGKAQISTIVTGVTASQALIDQAIAVDADAILVHHGYFWKGEPGPIIGMKRNRIKCLLQHDINLLAYHLPLDIHPEVGNNVELAKRMPVNDIQPVSSIKPEGVVYTGKCNDITPQALQQHLQASLGRTVLLESADHTINSIAWCTGGGQGYIEAAAELGVDAFVTGEVSEQTIHVAREMGVSFLAAGHHATERFGIQALGNWLKQQYALDVHFVDIPNPA